MPSRRTGGVRPRLRSTSRRDDWAGRMERFPAILMAVIGVLGLANVWLLFSVGNGLSHNDPQISSRTLKDPKRWRFPFPEDYVSEEAACHEHARADRGTISSEMKESSSPAVS